MLNFLQTIKNEDRAGNYSPEELQKVIQFVVFLAEQAVTPWGMNKKLFL